MKRIKAVFILTRFRAINNKGVRNTYFDSIGKCSHISGWSYRPTVIGRPDLPTPTVFEKMKITKNQEFFKRIPFERFNKYGIMSVPSIQ